MFKNFIVEILHATKLLKAKDIEIENGMSVGSMEAGSATIKNDLSVEGNTTIEKDLTVKEDLSVKGNATMEKDLTVKGNATMEKDLTVKEDLSVDGKSTFGNDVTINGNVVMKELKVDKIVDNGKTYGTTNEIKELTTNPTLNKNDGGNIPKPARVDHTHKIPSTIKNPYAFIMRNASNTKIVDYDGSEANDIMIDYNTVGAAKKNHASASTEYGTGSGSHYGHVKLSDTMSSSYGIANGVAATPKMVQVLADNIASSYIQKGSPVITGRLKVRNSVYLDGTDSEASDNTLKIYGIGNSDIVRIKLGSGNNSPILRANNDNMLYLIDLNTWNNAKLHKKLVDYTIEAFITPDSTNNYKKWFPAKSGWYRIYLVGGGGLGDSGQKVVISSTSPSASDSQCIKGIGLGTVHGSYGGGGGSVVIVDLLVNSSFSSNINMDEDSESDSTDIESDEVLERYALITFIKDNYIKGYNRDVGKFTYYNDGTNNYTGYRNVAISNLESLGTIVNKQSCTMSSSDGTVYDAYAGHGADGVHVEGMDAFQGGGTGWIDGKCYTAYGSGGGGVASGGTRWLTGDHGTQRTLYDSDSDYYEVTNRKENGRHGGSPGSIGITGERGYLGAPGAIHRYATYGAADSKKYLYVKDGDGACLSIAELDYFHGSPSVSDPQSTKFKYPPTASANKGGRGYYGGGHGGGSAATIINKNFTKNICKKASAQNDRSSSMPCVVIAYMGKSFI